ncbi:MAG: histidine kinase [Bacteroidota bacterium]
MRLRNWEVFVHVLIWIILYLVIIGSDVIHLGEMSTRQIALILFFSLLINAGIIYGYKFWALPKYLAKPQIGLFFLINFSFLLVGILLKSFIDFGYTSLLNVLTGFSEKSLTLGGWLRINTFTTFLVMLVANVYGFTAAWFRGQRLRYKLERDKLQSELSALKHQINPHFLFNILNGLYGLAYKNNDEPTAEGIAKLSQLMRYVLYESNDETVLLEKEINYIEAYIDLQRLRLHGATEVHFVVSGEVTHQRIAPMLFIPFIENAFKYGVSTVTPSSIEICIELTEKELKFDISNQIHQGQSVEQKGYGGIGLKNVSKRLELLYPDRYSLSYGPNGKAYHVTLNISL